MSGKPTWRYSDVATFWQRVAASYSALCSFLGNESRNDFREAHLALQPGFLLVEMLKCQFYIHLILSPTYSIFYIICMYIYIYIYIHIYAI